MSALDHEVAPVVVVDHEPARLRRPADLGVLIVLGVVLALLVLLGLGAQDTTQGANEDLARLVHHLPRTITHLLSFVASLGLLALPLAYVVDLLVRRQPRRLVEAVGAGIVSLVVSAAVGAAISAAPHSVLYHSLVITGQSGAVVTVLDGYLAAVVGFAVLGGITRRRPWRPLYAAAVVVYLVAALAGVQATVLALAVSYFLGAFVGVAARYVLGTVNDRPSGEAIAAALAERGQPLASLVRTENTRDRQRSYEAITCSGTRLQVTVLDRAMITSGALYRLYRMVRVQSEVARAPDVSLERAAERRALLSVSAEQAGVPVPRILEGVPCGPDTIVLAFEAGTATAAADLPQPPSEQALLRLWRQIACLHERRVTHRGLTPDAILVAPDGTLALTSPVDGTAFASNLRINLDRADLLVTSALLVGAVEAVRVAREAIGDDGLAAIRPVLQPVALSRETRLALRREKSLMSTLWNEIQQRLDQPVPQPPHLERVRPRTMLMLVAMIIAGYLLIGQLGSVNFATVFREVKWSWVPLVLAGSALTYLAAALTLTGLVRERLNFMYTLLAQLAASFAGFVTPPAVGGAATNVRYLQKAGLPATAAATSVAVNQVINAASHVLLLVIVAAATGSSANHRLPIPGWAFIALGGLVAAALVVFAVPAGRRWLLARIMPTVREAWPRLLDMATQPIKLAQSLGGTLLLNAAYVGALWTAVYAFGGSTSVGAVALVYLVGGAIGSVSPTPGGLGAVEAALSTGLAATGMPGASAVSAVLLFRVATFWLPVPAGWAAFTLLQRRGAL